MQETQETQVWSLGPEDPPGVGNGNLLLYSCLENPMDRGASLAGYSPRDCKESDTTERLSTVPYLKSTLELPPRFQGQKEGCVS